MIQPPFNAWEIGTLVVGVPAGVAFGLSQIALAVIAPRIQKQTKALGGDPPWGDSRSPGFWEYVRTWSDRRGDERLRRSMRIAEVLLVVQMVSLLLVVAVFVLQFFV